MNQHFQKKLVIFDVDNTILNWSDPVTIWTFRKYLSSRSTLSNKASTQRGLRNYTAKTTKKQRSIRFRVRWFEKCVSYIQQNQGYVAIMSDLPQEYLHSYFNTIGVFSIVDGLDIGCVKPLPDGGYQIMAQFGTPPSQTFLIGDNSRTDGRAVFAWGGHFIPFAQIQHNPIKELKRWL